MQACVEVWESDPEAYAYNPVGYIALGAAVQESDLTATFERQERIGYRSELIVGEAEVDEHMKALFPDWRARGVTVCLHEHQGGFAFNMDSVEGLHGKCREAGRLGRRRASRSRASTRARTARSEPSRPRPAASTSESRSSSRRDRGPGSSGACSGCPTRSTCTRRRGRRSRPADVDVLEPAGGRGRRRPAAVRDGRRWRPSRHPSRHGRTPVHGRRRPRHRRAVGDLLQA